MSAEDVKPLTDSETASLRKKWRQMADTLVSRDGTNERFANGGHKIKQNPVLIVAIEEIRDEYFSIFNRLRAWEKQLGVVSGQVSQDTKNDIDYDLIVLNHQSFLGTYTHN